MDTRTDTTPDAPPRELVDFLDASEQPQIVIDGAYRICAANSSYAAQFAGGDDVVGRLCHQVSHGIDIPCDQAGESCPLARARESGRRERVLHLHHAQHGEAYVDIELTPLAKGSGEARWFVEKIAPLRLAGSEPSSRGLIGRSAAFREMLELVARVGPSDASVLLVGESGTGKELVARAVHDASRRADHSLVVVDCASMAETLFESALFGHERGAFTGATNTRPGLVEAAHAGTLFLDEVGDIPLTIQVKLLRLLETGTFRRVGSTDLRHADLRIVSATHRDLQALMAEGRFREDLFFRLSTFPIRLPPLRERLSDLPLLVAALLDRVIPDRRLSVSKEALAALAAHRFPGNVRELRNVLERAALLSDGPTIEAGAVARALAIARTGAHAGQAIELVPGVAAAAGSKSLADLEAAAIAHQLDRHRGRRRDAAQALGISERTLYRRLKGL